MDAQRTELSVFFDGSCPLCRKEIAFYQKRRGADRVDWVDVSTRGEGDVVEGLSCRRAMARFHVRTADGALLDGGDGFAALWRVLPAFSWLGHAFRPPPLRWLLNRAYDGFLRIRPLMQRMARSQA